MSIESEKSKSRSKEWAIGFGLLAQLAPWKIVRQIGVGAIVVGGVLWASEKLTSSRAEK